jgi:iron complex outermembrane recepter protein
MEPEVDSDVKFYYYETISTKRGGDVVAHISRVLLSTVFVQLKVSVRQASCACAALGYCSLGLAQQSAPAGSPDASTNNNPDTLQEVVVTANKREESLRNVGLTITALSKQELAEGNITSLVDVAAAVPGLTYAQSADNTPVLTLRGVGYNDTSLGVYPAVSVYNDQAPLPFPVLASHAAFDLERIEVLKGPQGTLFGENSTGGAINYIAAKPTRTFQTGGDITYGRFNDVQGDAYISGPVTDALRVRLAVTSQHSDGWQVSSSRPDDKNADVSYTAARLLVDFDVSESFRLSLNLNGWQDNSQPEAGQFIVLVPQSPATVQPQEEAYPFSPQTPRAADWSTGEFTPRSDRTFYQAALRADADLTSAITLTSLTSFDHFIQSQTTDGDGTALEITNLLTDNGYIDSINQELRLANSTPSSLRWVVGGNYEKSRTTELQVVDFSNISLSGAGGGITSISTTEQQDIRNYALFGNADYDVTPALTIKAGARFTDSHNNANLCGFDSGDGKTDAFWNSLGEELGTVPFVHLNNASPVDQRCFPLNKDLVPGKTPFISSLDEKNVSWRVGLDYHLDQNALLYTNVSRGYKAGGFAILPASTVSQYAPVKQESVTAYELGAKLQFWDQKAQLDSAAFYYNYANKQILGKEEDPVFGILDALTNVPKSRVIGAEADLTVRPSRGLSLAGAVTYLNTEIQRYQGVNIQGQTQNFAGEPLPFAPSWNYSLSADYRLEAAGSGVPFIGLSVHGNSASDTTPGGSSIEIPASPVNRILPGLVHPYMTNAYATVDARLGYEASDGRWKIMLWGKNIFNKYYWTNVASEGGDPTVRFAGLPATYGITYSFAVK